MSTVFFRHSNDKTVVKAGQKHVVKESIIDGAKGVSFSFLEKTESDDKIYKVHVKQLESGDYEVSEVKGKASEKNKEDKKTIKEAEVLKMLSANKKLAFVNTYMTKDRKKILKEKGGAKYGKKSSKKASKKSSKKKSSKKKSSKKASKKSSKKKASKKSSKKMTEQEGGKRRRKASKKASKKSSKKKASKKSSKKKSSKKKASKKKSSKKH